MECPRCQKKILDLVCNACGNKILLPEANYCSACGEFLHSYIEDTIVNLDFNKRLACSDGLCVGVINSEGKCTECGKAINNH